LMSGDSSILSTIIQIMFRPNLTCLFFLTKVTQNISEYIQNIFIFTHKNMNTIHYKYDTASGR
jgi:hypothetical protein